MYSTYFAETHAQRCFRCSACSGYAWSGGTKHHYESSRACAWASIYIEMRCVHVHGRSREPLQSRPNNHA